MQWMNNCIILEQNNFRRLLKPALKRAVALKIGSFDPIIISPIASATMLQHRTIDSL
jgi:hypothetical protein